MAARLPDRNPGCQCCCTSQLSMFAVSLKGRWQDSIPRQGALHACKGHQRLKKKLATGPFNIADSAEKASLQRLMQQMRLGILWMPDVPYPHCMVLQSTMAAQEAEHQSMSNHVHQVIQDCSCFPAGVQRIKVQQTCCNSGCIMESCSRCGRNPSDMTGCL